MSNLTSDGELKLKIGLVGETGVGKSCLLVRYVDGEFFEDADKFTLGVDFKYKTVRVDDKDIKLQIHDTAGQERFRTVTASFYRGAQGILIVYDICANKDSFESKVTEWLSEVRKYTPDGTPVVLVGNKLDKKASRVISYEDAQAFAEKERLPYIETSAKDNTNVTEAFLLLARAIAKNKFPSRGGEGNVNPGTGNPGGGRRRFCNIL